MTLHQVQNNTDAIVVWPAVEAATMGCSPTPDYTAPSAPRSLARWITHRKGVIATAPRPVAVGGLHGDLVALAIARQGGIRCGEPFHFVPLLNNGVDTQAQFAIGGPARGDHVLIYLLNDRGATLGIIADSTGRDGPSLVADARVIQHLRFGGW